MLVPTISSEEYVADKNPSKALRRFLNTALVGQRQVPIVVSNVKRRTSDVEVECALQRRVFGVPYHLLPLLVRRLRKQSRHGAIRDDEARGPTVHDGREVPATAASESLGKAFESLHGWFRMP